jgi:hypothetical protein
MKDRVPGIENVEAKLTEDGRIVLRFQDGAFKDPFVARYTVLEIALFNKLEIPCSVTGK